MNVFSIFFPFLRQQVILILCFLLSFACLAQVSPRQGIVRDARTGEVLPGVNVTLKGTTRGTVTDADGRFSIGAQSTDVLVLSLIGMATQEVPVDKQTQLDIRLAEGARSLDEVVVVGYGQQSRRTLTGSVATIDQTVFKSVPRTNVGTALQGTAPGIRVAANDRSAGSHAYDCVSGWLRFQWVRFALSRYGWRHRALAVWY